MANCNFILHGIGEECNPSMGGLDRLLLFDAESNINNVLKLEGDVTVSVKNMPKSYVLFDGTITPDNHAFLYTPAIDSSSVTAESTIDLPNGINFTTTNIQLVFNRLDENKSLEFDYLSTMRVSNGIKGFYRDNNGKWFLVGAFSNLYTTAASISTGTAKGDGNTINLTLSDAGPYAPLPVNNAGCDALNKYIGE